MALIKGGILMDRKSEENEVMKLFRKKYPNENAETLNALLVQGVELPIKIEDLYRNTMQETYSVLGLISLKNSEEEFRFYIGSLFKANEKLLEVLRAISAEIYKAKSK